MRKWLLRARLGFNTVAWLAVAGLGLCFHSTARAQGGLGRDLFGGGETRGPKERTLSDSVAAKSSVPPAFTIPVESLGFSAPGPIYLGQRNALASLDFLDEDHILFTFRVPGLIHRQAGDAADSDERQIRAVVLALPAGTVQAQALWPVHDRSRYLWMLKDGHFLVRDKDSILLGDASLELKPYLHFPGPLLWIELDPTQQLMMTSSREPVAAGAAKAGDGAETQPDHPSDKDPSPGTLAAGTDSKSAAGQKLDSQPDLVLRILQRTSGQVLLVTRVRSLGHLPMNSDGYLEGLRGSGSQWMLNLNYFTGGNRILGHVDSTCSPRFDFFSRQELLVTGCTATGADRLVAMSTDGRRLWDDATPSTAVWPVVVMAPDGSRLARETLAATHPVNAYSPLDRDDVRGQMVHVFDAADGKVELTAPASPPLDAGGNVAISPSGRRVAVLHEGAIEVFELPKAPPVPAITPSDQAAH